MRPGPAPAAARSAASYSFIASVANTGFGDFQWKSPLDTSPATTAPLSSTNLQVHDVGGQNVLQSTLNMTYENFLDQVNLAEQ